MPEEKKTVRRTRSPKGNAGEGGGAKGTAARRAAAAGRGRKAEAAHGGKVAAAAGAGRTRGGAAGKAAAGTTAAGGRKAVGSKAAKPSARGAGAATKRAATGAGARKAAAARGAEKAAGVKPAAMKAAAKGAGKAAWQARAAKAAGVQPAATKAAAKGAGKAASQARAAKATGVKPAATKAAAKGAEKATPQARAARAAAATAAATNVAAKATVAKAAATKAAAKTSATKKPAAAKAVETSRAGAATPAAAKKRAAKPAGAKAAAKPAAEKKARAAKKLSGAKPGAKKPAAEKPARRPAAAKAAQGPAARKEEQAAPERKAARRRKVEEEQATAEHKAARRRKAEEEQATAEREAARRRKAEEEQAAAEHKAARRRKAEEEQAAAAERKASRRRKAEEEQAAAAERRASRRRKAEEEQAAAAERRTARREKAEAEEAAAAERRAARRTRAKAALPAGAEAAPAATLPAAAEEAATAPAAEAAPAPAAEAPAVEAPPARERAKRKRRAAKAAPAEAGPSPAAIAPAATGVAAPPEPLPLPPTPVLEAPVEGKGRRAIVDPLAVAQMLGDAAAPAAPLTEALPPLEPWEQELAAAAEARRREKEARRAERAKKHEARRAERKREREERAAALRGRGAEVVGTITVRPEGYGFLKRLEGPPGEDIFLPPDQLHGVMDGDRLRVRVVRGRFGRDAGELLEVLDRRRRHLLGTFYRRDRTTWVVPVDPTLPRFVPVRARGDIRDGQIVKVAITQYPEPGVQQLLGDVVKVVGDPGDPIVEVLEVAYSHGFAEDFPADVRDEAEAIPDHVLEEEKAGRRDLRGLRLVTIDGADARDFDDAVFVERKGSGYRLVVAIADVAHYVRLGSRLDEEALHRATSVYFPNHVLPMLPERLSNGICSLNPHVDRLCMVADITFDGSGRPLDAEVYQAVMNSHARCTYEQVADLLEGKPVPALDHVRDDLILAGELAQHLRERRIERGSLDFDLPEAKPVLDERMQVVDIVRRPRNDAHRLIEEFMLAANEAVARWFGKRELPTVYRVHGEPDPAKLENFVNLAQAVGFDFDLSQGITPVKLAEWLRRIEGSPQQKALNTLLLRSMMQAIYTPENIGHFGLGAEHYLHFTSPIRRYPDLLVHRLLKLHWSREERRLSVAELEEMEEKLADLAAQASQRERAAMEAEREIDAYFKCRFVEDKVGEIYGATIVSITDFGFFAEIDDFPVEGLVRAEELGTDWEFDPRQHRLVFGNGRSFGVGEHVQVEIAGVDLAKRQIGFVLVTDQRGEEVLPIRPRAFGKPRAPRSPTWVEAPPPSRPGKRVWEEDERRGPSRPPQGGGGYGQRGGAGPAEERPFGRREHRGYGDRAQRDFRREGERGFDRGPRDEGRFDRREGFAPGERKGGRFERDDRGASLTDAIARMRGGRGKRPGPPAGAPGAAPVERRGSRFAAGDRQAAWGAHPSTGRFAPSEGEERRGGKKGKKGKGQKGKQRPGKRERQHRRR